MVTRGDKNMKNTVNVDPPSTTDTNKNQRINLLSAENNTLIYY